MARWILCAIAITACSAAPGAAFRPSAPIGPIAAEPQRDGDPARGYDTIANGGIVTCGIPMVLYRRVFPAAPRSERIAGRTGHNRELPYYLTATESPRGVEVVAPNCLLCHAGVLRGEIIVGLGNHASDFTTNVAAIVGAGRTLTDDPSVRAELDHWLRRALAVNRHTLLPSRGPTPADNIAAVLFAHRDPRTLAWLGAPQFPIPDVVVPVDVPAWWLMRRKHAMFHTGAGRGDHGRLMMSASLLCTDSVADARAIDTRFGDVRAFIASIAPPHWPFSIDRSLAAAGRRVFEASCARCHGTYEGDGDYPNRIVGLSEVGTDEVLATGAGYFSQPFVEWFARSYYGQAARLTPAAGYVAPPLDGVWATAPYLHNGSVPTLAALLDSRARPTRFARTFDSDDYDRDAVGWRYTEAAADGPRVYDTRRTGFGNGGHRFGDALPARERRALLEYLKTL